ncbi:MAG: LAGLIDADG family homing endonuclease, partial [Candidatus Thermoplasmatota archaeon]
MGKVAELWKPTESGRIVCTACARYCKIGEGQVGLCGVRGVHDGKLWLYVYGKVITGHVDPIEKKPVMHYRPGSKIFSIATTGCSWLCRYCFLPGTLVLTENGHEPIEAIFAAGRDTRNPDVRLVENRRVLTHRGRWRGIEKAFQHLYAGTVLRVRPYYLPGFECTPNHGVYASIGGGPVRKVRAEELKIGDFLAIPRPRGITRGTIDVESLLRRREIPGYRRPHRLEIDGGSVRWSSERGPGLPTRLRLTDNVARLLGYYCAEGSVSWHRRRPNTGAVWFSFGSREEDRIRDVEHRLHSAFGVRTRRTRQGNRVAVVASSASLATFFQHLCGDSSATKRVPGVILQSTDRSVLRGFLAGYLNGDGYLTLTRSGLILGSSSVSTVLTHGVAQVFLTLGDVPKVYRAANPPEDVIEGRTVARSDDIMLRLSV